MSKEFMSIYVAISQHKINNYACCQPKILLNKLVLKILLAFITNIKKKIASQ